jgi:hypothetical protein
MPNKTKKIDFQINLYVLKAILSKKYGFREVEKKKSQKMREISAKITEK